MYLYNTIAHSAVFCKLVVKYGLGQEVEGLVIDSHTFCTNCEFVYNVLLID